MCESEQHGTRARLRDAALSPRPEPSRQPVSQTRCPSDGPRASVFSRQYSESHSRAKLSRWGILHRLNFRRNVRLAVLTT